MTDLQTRIAALTAAVEKMTPADWRVDNYYSSGEHCTVQDASKKDIARFHRFDSSTCGWSLKKDDAAGIVALRNNALAIIEAQAAEIERLRAALNTPYGYPDPFPSLDANGCCFACGEQHGNMQCPKTVPMARDPHASKCHATALDAGPTPLRGRVTRRDEG